MLGLAPSSRKGKKWQAHNQCIPGSAEYASSSQVPDQQPKLNVSDPVPRPLPPGCMLFSSMIRQASQRKTTPTSDAQGFKTVSRKSTTRSFPTRPGTDTLTKVTISWSRGSTNKEAESLFHNQSAGSIVMTAQEALNKLSIHPIGIIRGRWSTTTMTTGNFVFTLQGSIPAESIQHLEPALTANFPGDSNIAIPADGWMFAHIRNVPTRNATGEIWSTEEMIESIIDNKAFSNPDTCFPVPPCWLQPSIIVKNVPRSTIVFAYIDINRSLTNIATSTPFTLFGERAQFVPVGAKAVQLLCKKCWNLGHNTKDCNNQVRCFICGLDHEGMDHSFNCGKPTCKFGTCKCPLKCILCRKNGHTARAVICKQKVAVQYNKAFWLQIKKGSIDHMTGLSIASSNPSYEIHLTNSKNQPLSPATIL